MEKCHEPKIVLVTGYIVWLVRSSETVNHSLPVYRKLSFYYYFIINHGTRLGQIYEGHQANQCCDGTYVISAIIVTTDH